VSDLTMHLCLVKLEAANLKKLIEPFFSNICFPNGVQLSEAALHPLPRGERRQRLYFLLIISYNVIYIHKI
jgi:hypothetical protein